MIGAGYTSGMDEYAAMARFMMVVYAGAPAKPPREMPPKPNGTTVTQVMRTLDKELCYACHRYLPTNWFCRSRTNRRGTQHVCKSCTTAKNKQRHGEGWITPRDRAFVIERDGTTCANCGICCSLTGDSTDLARLTIDHVVPHAKGGASDASNYQVLCRSCNSKKGAR